MGNGWRVALTTLMNERAGLAFFLQVRLRQLLDRLIEEAAARDLLEDAVVANRLGELHLRAEVLRLTAYRGLTAIEKYGQPGPEGSLTKWMWSETNQLLTQFAADLLGPEALVAGGRWSYELLRARGNSIEGGPPRCSRTSSPSGCSASPRLARRAVNMDFDLTEDQREIKSVAHELLAARSPMAKVRQAADAGQYDAVTCGRRSSSWAGRGSPSTRSTGARGWAPSSSPCCSRSSATPAPPRHCLSTAVAAAVIQAAGTAEQRERWLPGLVSGELTAGVGVAELIVDGQGADVVVLVDGDSRPAAAGCGDRGHGDDRSHPAHRAAGRRRGRGRRRSARPTERPRGCRSPWPPRSPASASGGWR